MTASLDACAHDDTRPLEARVSELEAQFRAMKEAVTGATPGALVRGADRVDRLSMIVFSGSLDRQIAAFTLATGAAAMGTEVDMFFTFWATTALRRGAAVVGKTFVEHLFGLLLPKSSSKLPLSRLNMAGAGPFMLREMMKKKGVASLEELIGLSAELGVRIKICTMSLDLLGMRADEMIEYPGLGYCGVATFLETASDGKLTLFV